MDRNRKFYANVIEYLFINKGTVSRYAYILVVNFIYCTGFSKQVIALPRIQGTL